MKAFKKQGLGAEEQKRKATKLTHQAVSAYNAAHFARGNGSVQEAQLAAQRTVLEEGGVVVDADLVYAPAPEPPAEPPKDTLSAMMSYTTPAQAEVMQEDGEHRMAF